MTQVNLSTNQKGGKREGGMDCAFGMSRCKLLHIEWISKILLYSTGNYIQYPMINHNGKDNGKEYICITEPCYYRAEINTAL